MPTEKQVIFAADDSGVINIPAGTAEEIESWHVALTRLERQGYVKREHNARYYGPFRLTEIGEALRLNLSQAE